MSSTLYRYGAVEPPVSTGLSTTDETTILSGLTTYIKVLETVTIANVDQSNACYCTLRWVDAASAASVFWQGDIAAGETKVIENIPIIIDGKGAVRSLTAQAESANDLVVTVITSAQSKQTANGG